MVQLKKRRTLLLAYALLLVLPTAVLGVLHWRELRLEHRARMANVPGALEDAARRLSSAIEERMHALYLTENHRGFFHYRRRFFPKTGDPLAPTLLVSPLEQELAPEPVLLWFSYDFAEGPDARVEVFRGQVASRPDGAALEARLRAALADMIAADWQDSEGKRQARRNDLASLSYLLPVLAYNHCPARTVADLAPVREAFAARPDLLERKITADSFSLHLRFFREGDGTPRLVAMRHVVFAPLADLSAPPTELAPCVNGVELVQGFYLDPEWLFGTVPRAEAANVLDGSMWLLEDEGRDGDDRSDAEAALAARLRAEGVLASSPIRLVTRLGLELASEGSRNEFRQLRVAVSTRDLEADFWRQARRFFAVGTMLAISLATGMGMLLRSVRQDLERARQTENFVASVTHELRTPLTAIRLYGEMLKDGWVGEEEKKRGYYARILRETGRLETLVERVLSKARLASEIIRTRPGDLNEIVESALPDLLEQADEDFEDIAFAPDEDLGPVELNGDAVRSILVNLVENARKYAPASRPGTNGDGVDTRILVRTRSFAGRPVLEVCDRGPGIAPKERERIFEAFYRVGTESTRVARGTGLGLHLVAIQAEAMGGGVEVVEREGGGTIFRVSFRVVAPPRPAASAH